MKKYFKLIIFTALTISFIPCSQAALLIEPAIGYSAGKINFDSNVNKDTDEVVKGMSYGGRLGYQNFGLQVGADYLASSLDVDGDGFKTTEFGVFAGYRFPVFLKVYAAYIFSGTGDLERGSGAENLKLKGASGPKIGLGFTILPFLDINLEYRTVAYDKKTLSTGEELKVDYNAVMVGISLPFTL